MPSYLSYLKRISIFDDDDNIESWITVNGNHIPIMKGQTKAEAVTVFIDKKESQKNDGLIRAGSPSFGTPGKYEVFRFGDLSAPNGTIFTSSDIEHAREYTTHQDDVVNRYHVDIKNPLVVEGENDVAVLKNTYKRLFGRDFGDKLLDSVTWPKYDAMIARKLSHSKYDALLTKQNGRGREVQLPKGAKMELTGSYKQSDLDWDTQNEEYKRASEAEAQLREEYSKFVNNPPLNKKTEEEIKKMAEEMRKTGLEAARYIKSLRKYMVYETYNRIESNKNDTKK